MSQIGQIRGSFISSSNSGYSNSLSSTTVSATTFFGNISARFIGTGTTIGEIPNFVTNTEFSYLSGITSNTQTQINTKSNKSEPFLTYSSDTRLTDYKQISAGTNINFSSSSTHFSVSSEFDLFNPNIIYDTPTIPSNKIIVNYNPQNFSDTYPNRATHIMINATATTQIFNLSANTFDSSLSRFVTITNNGKYLIILGGVSSGITGFFAFDGIRPGTYTNDAYRTGYFLSPGKSISLIWSSNSSWYQVNTTLFNKSLGLDMIDYFLTVPDLGNNFANINSKHFRSKNYSTICLTTANSCFVSENQIGISGPLMNIYIFNGQAASMGNYSNNSFQSMSGGTFLFTTFFKNSILCTPPTRQFPKIFGTSNDFTTKDYKSLTNNLTTIPNVSGGTFLLEDYSINPNYWSMCIQTSDGSTIISPSTLPYSALTDVNVDYHLGLFTINPSGNSFGSTTFFWKRSTSTFWTIENEIQHTGATINGYPLLTFYGLSGVTSVPTAASGLQFGMFHMGQSLGYII
jgi:hypothetical protein